MDIFSLDMNYDPLTLIENYESVAWTERYYTAGQFELTTHDIKDTMFALPLDGPVGCSLSKQIMVVEEHLIETDDKGNDVLKVSGRSADGLMDTRYLLNGYYSVEPGSQPEPRMTPSGTPAQAAFYLIAGGYLPVDDFFIAGYGDPNHDFTMAVPLLSPEVIGLGITTIRYFKAGSLESAVREALSEIDAGLKSDRTYTTGIASGEFAMWIYKGRDLTQEGGDPDYITFSVDNGDFKRVSYLRSKKNFKNTGLYFADLDPADETFTGHKSVALPMIHPSPYIGFNRRELYVSTVEPFRSEEFTFSAPDRALKTVLNELRKNQRTIFITAEMSDALKDEYNETYALGDLVTFRGGYNITSAMQITEFTRIQDSKGERAYPTLTETVI